MSLSPVTTYKLYYFKRLRYASYMELFPVWLLDDNSFEDVIGPLPSQELDTYDSNLSLVTNFLDHIKRDIELVANDMVACISYNKKLSNSVFGCLTTIDNPVYSNKDVEHSVLVDENLNITITPSDWICRSILQPILPHNELFC